MEKGFVRRRRRGPKLERAVTKCARCDRPVHPNRDSEYCDATCAALAREREDKLERARASARIWLYRRRFGS